MRVAVIGAGSIGQLHARVLAAHPLVEELVVADVDRGRAEAIAAAADARVADVDAAIDGADALVVAAATEGHAALVRAGIARRIPTFCEKPLATDLAESARLVVEIDESGIPFQLGFQRRYDAAYREARRLVATAEIGRLYELRMTATDHTPPSDSYLPSPGNYFRDSWIHDFDASRYITAAEVESIYVEGAVRGFERLTNHGDLDTAVATIRMRDGTLASLAGGRHNPRGYDVRMELVGSRDAVVVGLGPRTPIRPLDADAFAMETGWDSYLDRFESAYRAELAAFMEVAVGQAPSACTARDGLEAMRIAEAATRSRAERRVVDLEEIESESA